MRVVGTRVSPPPISLSRCDGAAALRWLSLHACKHTQPILPQPVFNSKQVTTCRGVVMGRLRSAQRQREVELMRFCFNKLGERRR